MPKDLPQEEKGKDKGSSSRPFWRRLLLSLGILAAFFLSSFWLVQLPSVQNWTVRQLTNYLSNRLQTKVQLDYFQLGFFNKLILEGVYVEDLQSDTLLYSERLVGAFDINPFRLIRDGITIEHLEVYNTQFRLRRSSDVYYNNLTELLQKLNLAREEKENDSKPLPLDVQQLDLFDVSFIQEDNLKGQRLQLELEAMEVGIEFFDLAALDFILDDIYIRRPLISITERERAPLWNDSLRAPPPDSARLFAQVGSFKMEEGTFRLNNFRKEPIVQHIDSTINYRHMYVSDIGIDIRNFQFRSGEYTGVVESLYGKERSGFQLDQLAVQDARVSPNGIFLNDFQIVTPQTNIRDTLYLEYSKFKAFKAFTDEVRLNGRFNDSRVAIRDIIRFAPKLGNSAFFKQNLDQVVRLNGRIFGTINDLSARELQLELPRGSRLQGRFDSRNLAVKNEEFVSARLEELTTRADILRDLLPSFSPPSNFDRLGKIQFNGRFDGFFVDFVANGSLQTNIGQAVMDMRMDLKPRPQSANFSGNLNLNAFDLGAWTGNPAFGLISFNSQVENGSGIRASDLSADLEAAITSFAFKGYAYENARLKGRLESRQFNGAFAIKDDNIDFSFEGSVNLKDSIPRYDFQAAVNNLSLKELNLSNKVESMAGKVQLNLSGNKLSSLNGEGIVRDLKIRAIQEEFLLDSIRIASAVISDSLQLFSVRSDILLADLSGDFELSSIVQSLLAEAEEEFPRFAALLNLPPADSTAPQQAFTFNLRVNDSRGLQKLIHPQLGPVLSAEMEGTLNTRSDIFELKADLPEIQFDEHRFQAVALRTELKDGKNELIFGLEKTILSNGTELAPINTIHFLDEDRWEFGIIFDPKSRIGKGQLFQKLDIDGSIQTLNDSTFELHFDRTYLDVLEERWSIAATNSIRFGHGKIQARDFTLTNGDRKFSLNNLGSRGLLISLDEFDFSWLREKIKYDYPPIDFQGKFDLQAEIGNVFEQDSLSLRLLSDTLLINGDDWGTLSFEGFTSDLKSPIEGYLHLNPEGNTQLLAEAVFEPNRSEEDNPSAGKLLATLDLTNLPLDLAEYWIGKTVNGMEGQFGGWVSLNGPLEELDIDGQLEVGPSQFTVEYLKTTYRFDEAKISVSNTLFDASGTLLYDERGNTAALIGGVSHNRLKDLGFNARLETDRFLALNTKKGDNQLFYGTALGDGEISFSGSFKQPNIYVNADVGKGTRIVIPVSAQKETTGLGLVRFVDKSKPEKDTLTNRSRPIDLKGVNLEMDLTADDEAELAIIFNEQAGDVIEGRGRGSVRISVPRTGDFSMYGDYVIERGDYLFTLYNVINKKFRIRQGGTISWSGDPFAAQIDLVAEYKGLNTSVANLIQEYLVSASTELKRQASQTTTVNLLMQLEGDLLKPQISFDLLFPNLKGELQSYVDSKLRVLSRNQNELNKQVFGLIIAGQFMPTEFVLDGQKVVFNTVSEFVSNQLSLLLTELFSEFIGDGKTLSSIDFDIAYNQYESVNLESEENFTRGNELQLSLRQNFFNDRLSVLVGGNIGLGGGINTAASATGAFVGNDLVIEYTLNRDRSLKLRVYQQTQPDFSGLKLEIGAGLSFRKEFQSFDAFWDSFKKDSKKQQ